MVSVFSLRICKKEWPALFAWYFWVKYKVSPTCIPEGTVGYKRLIMHVICNNAGSFNINTEIQY